MFVVDLVLVGVRLSFHVFLAIVGLFFGEVRFLLHWLPFMCRCNHDKNLLFIGDVYFFLLNCKSITWFPLGLYRS